MQEKQYTRFTQKLPHKKKPRTKPLPKATARYLEAEEAFTHTLDILGIKYQKKYQIKSTKHWRFDFLLIEYNILVELAGGPWSGGRGGRLKNKAWSIERYDVAEELGFDVVRLETATTYKDIDNGPLQMRPTFADGWLKKLMRSKDGTDQAISTD
ncbi:MAG: hypothetical protein QM666_00920 [Acinetobacter sp.]